MERGKFSINSKAYKSTAVTLLNPIKIAIGGKSPYYYMHFQSPSSAQLNYIYINLI